MKFHHATIFASLMLGSLPTHAGEPIINLSVGGEISPGVYGQVQFGNAPPPPVLYDEPRIIVRQPPNVMAQPIYMHVPPGHAKNWAKHCREYNACNRPVYFVKSREYQPGYRERKEKKSKHESRQSRGRGGERSDEWQGDERREEGRGHRD